MSKLGTARTTGVGCLLTCSVAACGSTSEPSAVSTSATTSSATTIPVGTASASVATDPAVASPTPAADSASSPHGSLAPGMTWTLVPSGDGCQVTESPVDGQVLDWSYAYSGIAGEGFMLVTNLGGYEPLDSTPTPTTIDGYEGVVHQGARIAFVTLDGVDDLIATVETEDEGTIQAMDASLKVQQIAQIETDEPRPIVTSPSEAEAAPISDGAG